MFTKIKMAATLAATLGLLAFAAPVQAAETAPAGSAPAAGTAAAGKPAGTLSAKGTMKASPSTSGATALADGCPTAGEYLSPWALVFRSCVFTVTTDVRLRCSNGAVYGPLRLPPATYDIYTNCYPAFFSSLSFTPV